MRGNYRTWRGTLHGPMHSIWPIARVSLNMMLRRRLFWAVYGLALLIFCMYFFGQYLLAWAESQASENTVSVGPVHADPERFIGILRDRLQMNGSANTYLSFIGWQASMVMAVLVLAGSIIVGNDFQYGSLPFYLSKPPGRLHYLLGKGLAVAFFVNLLTTLPALALFVQYGFLDSWGYFSRDGWTIGFSDGRSVELPINPLLPGILGYGLLLTVCLTLLLLAAAVWLRRTLPLIMMWTTAFVFLRLLASSLVDGLHYDPRWRLIDLWNNLYLGGAACMGIDKARNQPALTEAMLVLGTVCIACAIYLNLRIRAVEIVK